MPMRRLEVADESFSFAEGKGQDWLRSAIFVPYFHDYDQ
jgi:hypothetical protein